MMELPKCQKCNNGLLIPLSDYGQEGASVIFKAWACTEPGVRVLAPRRQGRGQLREEDRAQALIAGPDSGRVTASASRP